MFVNKKIFKNAILTSLLNGTQPSYLGMIQINANIKSIKNIILQVILNSRVLSSTCPSAVISVRCVSYHSFQSRSRDLEGVQESFKDRHLCCMSPAHVYSFIRVFDVFRKVVLKAWLSSFLIS